MKWSGPVDVVCVCGAGEGCGGVVVWDSVVQHGVVLICVEKCRAMHGRVKCRGIRSQVEGNTAMHMGTLK